MCSENVISETDTTTEITDCVTLTQFQGLVVTQINVVIKAKLTGSPADSRAA